MTTGPRARFPRSARVRLRAEYAVVFEKGRRSADPLFALHWLAGPQPPRLGLAVSRKVDPRAVGRNRIKRVLREATRRLRPQLAGGDYVVVARVAARSASNAQPSFTGVKSRSGTTNGKWRITSIKQELFGTEAGTGAVTVPAWGIVTLLAK